MDHIFGDSHDIAFGANPASPAKNSNTSAWAQVQKPRHVQHDDFADLSDAPAPQRPRAQAPVPRRAPEPTPIAPRTERPRTERPAPVARPQVTPLPEKSLTIPLASLIDGMKSSFLPREEDTTAVRLVALSWVETQDPLILVTRDDTTIVVGSGFGTMTRAGQSYVTFPDMRLVASEKSRLSAWILFDASIDVTPFQSILPALGFPPIYATRDIIAKFRNTITDTDFLWKCRFFELFADGMSERRIGDIEWKTGACLSLKSWSTEVGFAHLPIVSGWVTPSVCLTRSTETYTLSNKDIASGEILTFRGSDMEVHTMKFTFDRFFIDKGSVGVVAWYTIGDREQLSENGVLMFTLEEDTRARTIAGHIFIDSRGFVHAHEMMSVHKEILKGIRATYEKLITENPKIDRGTLVQWLRREITKYCYLLTGRTPVVMPILIER